MQSLWQPLHDRAVWVPGYCIFAFWFLISILKTGKNHKQTNSWGELFQGAKCCWAPCPRASICTIPLVCGTRRAVIDPWVTCNLSQIRYDLCCIWLTFSAIIPAMTVDYSILEKTDISSWQSIAHKRWHLEFPGLSTEIVTSAWIVCQTQSSHLGQLWALFQSAEQSWRRMFEVPAAIRRCCILLQRARTNFPEWQSWLSSPEPITCDLLCDNCVERPWFAQIALHWGKWRLEWSVGSSPHSLHSHWSGCIFRYLSLNLL